LGQAKEHTVYKAEAIGLTLAAKLIATEQHLIFPISILVDNQAVIQSGEITTPRAGHYLIDRFRRMIQLIKTRNQNDFNITVRWISAHSNVPGNEKADEEAKRAALGPASNSNMQSLPKFLRNG
ncbi:hypothetical protein DEU56DRAFT_701662, partial [Suillus clintonianus]|uniref:uncharacterized protein n=1 Tax=Suillus clintonianus TaxID=1904413 RepID=UPI001B886592